MVKFGRHSEHYFYLLNLKNKKNWLNYFKSYSGLGDDRFLCVTLIENTEVADKFITSKNPGAMWFFIIKPRNTGRLKKRRSVWIKPPVGAHRHTRKKRLPSQLEDNEGMCKRYAATQSF